MRYAQCWEDTDLLIEAAAVQPGDRVLSICSAGDNTLALLAQNPSEVHAIDLNRAQLAALELRVAAFATMEYDEVLAFLGCRPCGTRVTRYRKCRTALSLEARSYWDRHLDDIQTGIIKSGRFEKYFALFRNVVLPLAHTRREVADLLMSRTPEDRKRFYHEVWNNRTWQGIFRMFFSRTTLGALGRDPSFFRYADGDVADFLAKSTEYALTELDPSENHYLRWILTGSYEDRLPYYLRRENFDSVRNNLTKLSISKSSLERVIKAGDANSFNVMNLSDVFEYMSEEAYERLLQSLLGVAANNCRLVYWNMLAPRSCPSSLAGSIIELNDRASALYARNKTFFYSRFVLEQVKC